MTARRIPHHYRVGDLVALDDLDGEVVTIRNIGQNRQVVGVKTVTSLMSLTVEVVDGQIVPPPVDVSQAISLAVQITMGHDPHIPVTTQIRSLATALLAVTGTTTQGGP